MESHAPLRIVIPMLNYYPDRPSGSTRLAYDEALYLARLGHEVWVVAQDLNGGHPEYSIEQGLHILRYPSPQLGALDRRRTTAHQRQTTAILQRHLHGTVDVIHGHVPLQHLGAVAAFPKARRCYSIHSPVLLEMRAAARGAGWQRRLVLAISARLLHRLEYRCLREAQHLTAESEFVKTLVGQLHSPQLGTRVQVVPGWVDTQRFQVAPDRAAVKQDLSWPADRPVLFTLRRLVPRMGLDRLLRALAKLREAGRDFQMVIGGRGPLQATLEAMAADLRLADRVQFLGFVSDEDLPRLYAAADAFVLPTAELEGFGLIALEALACGVPVLATPAGAIPEVLNNFEPRWLADNASVEAIAALLTAFLEGDLPSHRPEELRTVAETLYDQERVLPRLIAATVCAPEA